MADEPEAHEDVLELDEVAEEGEEPEIETPESEDDEPEEEEYTLELEGDDGEDEILRESEDDTPLQKKLRAKLREEMRDAAEVRRERDELKRQTAAAAPKIEVGEKPTLETCEWDEERFEAELDAWKDRRAKADNVEAEQAKANEARQAEHNKRLSNYVAKLAELPIPAEQKQAAQDVVVGALPEILQNAVVTYADNPAKVVVALAKYPKKLAALAQEQDPIRFIIAIRDMERSLKEVRRNKPPAPESGTIPRGSAAVSSSSGKTLEKLEKQARETGDRSKLIAYKETLRKRA